MSEVAGNDKGIWKSDKECLLKPWPGSGQGVDGVWADVGREPAYVVAGRIKALGPMAPV